MNKTKGIVVCAFFTAVICVTAPFAIAIGPVPITLALFSIPLVAFVGGSKIGAVSTLIYTLIGLAGMPVFSGFKGGFGVAASPTGGFMFSYVFIALILGQCVKTKSIWKTAALFVCALLVCYVFGTVHFVVLTKSGVWEALTLCVLPFIPFDVVKFIMAYIVGGAARKRLVKAKLL